VYTHAGFMREGLLLGALEGQQYFHLCFEFDVKNNRSYIFGCTYHALCHAGSELPHSFQTIEAC
jgi:hypothetical protein